MLVLEALTRIRWMELNEIELAHISGPATLAGDNGTNRRIFLVKIFKMCQEFSHSISGIRCGTVC